MDLSKGQKLRNKIEELKSETGLDDDSVKQIFVKEYLLDEEEKDPDKMMSDFLHGKQEEE